MQRVGKMNFGWPAATLRQLELEELERGEKKAKFQRLDGVSF